MNWYVLFVRTGLEHKVEQLLKKKLDTDVFMPFVPMLEILLRFSRQTKKELKPLFPSYVFIESEISSSYFINKTGEIISSSHDVIRLLRYGDADEIAVREHEKNALLNLCNDDYCIKSSRGIMLGNKVYIKEGPLKGMESIIKKIDRHKKRASIDLDFMGEIRQINVALEIMEKL